MQREQNKVIMIKDDQEQEQCNNRIYYLRAQRICQRNARQCRQCCQACENHGDERLKREHVRIQVQKFKRSFQNLQASCSRQTQHYIRQMNDAQKKAVQEIRRKKEEYFKQIQEVKAHMMKKTYRTLEEKYTNLYEKFKNDRLDLLRCCEVFWVMNALPSSHSIKYSEINKKLEGILRKFQTFKQVSRNLPSQNMFNSKEKVKKAKISQKIGVPQVRKDPVHLQKVSYDSQLQEKYRKAINAFSQQLKQLKNQKTQRQKQLTQLELQIRNRIRKLELLKSKLTFQPKILEYKYPESQRASLSNLRPFSVENQNKSQPKPFNQQKPKQNKFIEMLNFIQSNQIQPNKHKQQQMVRSQQQNEEKSDIQMINQDQQNQPKEKQHNQKSNQKEQTNLSKQNQSKQNAVLVQQKEAMVKVEFNQEPFIQWQNSELVQDIRKYGNNISQGLKVQLIDCLNTFSYVRASLPSIKINSNLMKKPQSLAKNDNVGSSEKKVTNFTILASQLFQKHEMKKTIQGDKQQKTDKAQKDDKPDKQL